MLKARRRLLARVAVVEALALALVLALAMEETVAADEWWWGAGGNACAEGDCCSWSRVLTVSKGWHREDSTRPAAPPATR